MSVQSFAINTLHGVHVGFVAMSSDDNLHGQMMIKAQTTDAAHQNLPEFMALQDLSDSTLSWQVKGEKIDIFNDKCHAKLHNGYLTYKNFSYILNDLTGAL